MKITILTLFPEMFVGPFEHSIVKRAKEKNLVEIDFINIRDFGEGSHKVVDDTEYGGGIGMLMKVDVVHQAILNAKCKEQSAKCKEKIVLMSASGKIFKQAAAKQYANLDHLILICG
ncbi:MAG TPA: tRNA (guanosine(37)-N1)-methyltransferase TrmD, partial [Patescibacteria group bacterium]